MRRHLGPSFLAMVVLLIAAGSASAQAIQQLLDKYDESKSVVQTGVVTDILWANTHCVLYLDIKGGDGKAVNYAIELTNPRTLIAMGVTPVVLAPGKELTVTFSPSITATNHGLVKLIKSGDKLIFDANKSLSELNNDAKPAPKKKK